MPKLTKVQRNLKYKDETIDRLLSKAQEDSRQQAKEVARLYKDGKFRNWLTAKNLLTRFAEGSNRSRIFARKAVDSKAKDWDRYRVKDERKLALAKNREKAAISRITTSFKNYKFRQQRIVDSVEVGEKPYKAIHNNVIKFRLKKAHPELPDSDNKGDFKIPSPKGAPHPDSDYGNVEPKMKAVVIELVKKMLKAEGSMKLQLIFNVVLWKELTEAKKGNVQLGSANEITIEQEPYSVRPAAVEVSMNNVEGMVDDQFDTFKTRLEAFMHVEGSGWSVKRFVSIEVVKYATRKERASSYIPTPIKYRNSRCGLINIQNDDELCLKWCMLYHQTEQKKHDDRVTVLKKVKDKYNWDNVDFPASFKDIQTFEHNNKESVFVYGINDKEAIYKLRNGNSDYLLANQGKRINLLYVEEGAKAHYVYIKSLSRLFDLTKNAVDRNKNHCPFCNKKISTDFCKHLADCNRRCSGGTAVTLPEKGSVMKFDNPQGKTVVPFIVYADIECTLEKTGNVKGRTHKHVPNSCCYYFVCTDDPSRNQLKTFHGANCVHYMLLSLQGLANKCVKEMKKNEPMNITPEEQEQHNKATHCHICNNELNGDSVRDHDHETGKYRGAAHSKCNINYFQRRRLPIVFHNLKNYDSHFLLQQAFSLKCRNIWAIPNNNEKFISFGWGELKFIDSIAFMNTSLDKLVQNLKDGDPSLSNFNNFKSVFKEHAELLCRKGFYPYEWVDSENKLKYYKGLPPKEDFYSSLKQEGLTDEEYEHAQQVYKVTGCKKFKDYHDIYLETDVVLLADVFENFRKVCLSNYDLDPANYYTAPGLAWDAMLLQTKIELELIHDEKILDIMERHKKGGLCFVGSQRLAEANNKYLDTYDKDKDSNYIIYWDANNLYGWAMCESLPYKDLKFSTATLDEVLSTDDDADTGYVLEVDLSFPKEIHEKVKQFPPCPENVAPPEDWMSQFQKDLAKEKKIKVGMSKKLTPHLHPHKNYVIHYRNLKYAVGLGVEVTAVHNVVSFTQSKWMEPYIAGNSKRRGKAKNEFEKDFYKLMNNSVFGKTMEDVRNRIKLHLTTDDKDAIRQFSKPLFKQGRDIDGLYLIEMKFDAIEMKKPIYVGTSILDISKVCMMKFHYEVIEKEFEGRYGLLYSDTDSLVYQIFTDDIYEWMQSNPGHFDLKDSKVPGLFKDEKKGKLIKSFCALNPKCYSFTHEETWDKEDKCFKTVTHRCKGVNNPVVKNELTHEDYKNTLATGDTLTRNVMSFRSIRQQVYTVVQEKKVLRTFYDKMQMTDSYNNVPYGYIDGGKQGAVN